MYGFVRKLDLNIAWFLESRINSGLLQFIPVENETPILYGNLYSDLVLYEQNYPDAPIYDRNEFYKINTDLLLLLQYGVIKLKEIK